LKLNGAERLATPLTEAELPGAGWGVGFWVRRDGSATNRMLFIGDPALAPASTDHLYLGSDSVGGGVVDIRADYDATAWGNVRYGPSTFYQGPMGLDYVFVCAAYDDATGLYIYGLQDDQGAGLNHVDSGAGDYAYIDLNTNYGVRFSFPAGTEVWVGDAPAGMGEVIHIGRSAEPWIGPFDEIVYWPTKPTPADIEAYVNAVNYTGP
jgi:catechol 2,3-dioxygenase-like lactoylglutathione lyase family enzyme